MKTETFIHGIYPRSEALVTASRGFDRRRVTQEEFVAQQQIDTQNVIALQQAEGLSFVEDGKITWQDIFRPFTQTSTGLSSEGGLIRWFNNNTFFRIPVISGPLVPDFAALDEFFPPVGKDTPWKVTLPSPFTFARLAQDTTGARPEETLEKVTLFIKSCIQHLESRGVSFVQLNEPYLPYHGAQKDDIAQLLHSLSLLDVQDRTAQLAIHLYFGDGAPVVRALENQHFVDVVGVDFLKTSVDDLPTDLGLGLIAGVVDGRNSLIESTATVAPFLNKIAEHSRPTTLFVSHASDLELLPEKVAQQKVQLLGGLQTTV